MTNTAVVLSSNGLTQRGSKYPLGGFGPRIYRVGLGPTHDYWPVYMPLTRAMQKLPAEARCIPAMGSETQKPGALFVIENNRTSRIQKFRVQSVSYV